MADKVVAYLDLLGFSNAVNTDPDGAVMMLQGQASALEDAIVDEMLHPASSYPDSAIQLLAEAGLATSFETFLPMSDSVFITSSDPNLFVRQLSHLLVSQFDFRLSAFANPESSGDPRQVTMRSVEVVGGAAQVSTRQASWWPILYRGGVTYGDVQLLKMPAISSVGKTLPNLAGKAVVESVGLEKLAGKGPRLACTEAFAKLVTGGAADFIEPTPTPQVPGQREILWPMAMFADSTGPEDAFQNPLHEWLTGAINLWCHFATGSIGVHYLEFIDLTIRSFQKRWPQAKQIWPHMESLPNRLTSLRPSRDDALQMAFGSTP